MNYHFVQGISDIQETQGVFESRTTALASSRNHHFNMTTHNSPLNTAEDILLHDGPTDLYAYLDNSRSDDQSNFNCCKEYIERTISSMGLQIDDLDEYQHRKTLKCLLSLISQCNDLQTDKSRMKAELNQQKFQKNKYISLLDQAQKTNKQKNKKLGVMQNNFEQLKNKLKKIEKESKKERDEDRKMIAMLKSKNEQIIHEVKKKENEANRLKQQMRKNVINEKQSSKASSVANFQIYDAFKKKNTVNEHEGTERANMLAQKFEGQRKTLVRQNLLLKQKLYDIREEIVKFAQWLDENIFGEKNDYSRKFIINHNLLFRKESIVDEFMEILNDARAGINEVMVRETKKLHYDQNTNYDHTGLKNSLNFGLKSSTELTQKECRTERSSQALRQSLKMQQNKVRSPRKTEPFYKQDTRRKTSMHEGYKKKKMSSPVAITPIRLKSPKYPQKYTPSQEEDAESQISMISHISMNEMMKKDKQIEKWDLLFNDQD